MRVLVDHGSSIWNVGDAAMLEGAVRRLLDLDPRIEAWVLAQSDHLAAIFERPRVHRVEAQVTGPLFGAPRAVRNLHRPAAAGPRSSAYFHLLGALMWLSPALVTSRKGTRVIRSFCADYDALHVVGGGFMNDVFPREMWRKAALVRAFHRLHRPVVLTGQQVGPFRSRLTEAAARRALRLADVVGLREPAESRAFCGRFGVPAESSPVGGDDSLGLPADSGAAVDALLARHGLASGRFLAVNTRVDFYGLREDHLDRFGGVIRHLAIRTGLPLAFVPITAGADPNGDHATGRRLGQNLGVPLPLVEVDPGRPALAKALVGRAYAAVGTSYHFCTFALSSGRPAACVWTGDYYGQKARGLSAFWQEAIDFELADAADPVVAEGILAAIEARGIETRLAIRARDAAHSWDAMFEGPIRRALLAPRRSPRPAGSTHRARPAGR